MTGYNQSGFFYPISYLEGVQVDFEKLASWATLDTLQDYRDLVARWLLRITTHPGMVSLLTMSWRSWRC